MKPEIFYIGLMSGTSLDGVDGVMARFDGPVDQPVQIVAHAHRAFAADFARELLALNTASHDEIHRSALAANSLARGYAAVVGDLLVQAGCPPSQVRAIGAHGQTVRHRPGEFDGTGYSVQINNPALLAELTGIDVVAEFRMRDVAAGGQGAPLVPAFHRFAFAGGEEALAVVNLGGMANVTLINTAGVTLGFDSGPGNALLDLWCLRHTGKPYDEGGLWGTRGAPVSAVLAAMQAEPYFALPPPKSTGRDLFNAEWLDACLQRAADSARQCTAADIQATLVELTAWSVAQALQAQNTSTARVLAAGGGTHNAMLMRRLAALCAPRLVTTTERVGVAADQVEAAAFAWLAKACVERQPGNVASVTGARGARILGAVYPAA